MIKCAKIEGKLKIPAGPMETKTTAMIQFQPYRVKPVKLAHNPRPDYYIKPRTKFGGESWTKSVFKGEKGDKALQALKARECNIKIDKSESLNLNTNYRDAFVNHGISMCEAKAYLIAKLFSNNKSANTSLEKNNASRVSV